MKNLIIRSIYSFKTISIICLLTCFNYGVAQTTGRGNISKFDSNWELSTVMEDHNWYSKWDEVIAIDIDNDGADELLCYAKVSSIAQRGNALADIYDVSSSGQLKLIKRDKNWSKIWDKIIPLDVDRDGKSELLCYSKNSSLAEPGRALADIYDISSTGNLKLLKRHTNWFNGWDELEALNIDSDNDRELLCYAKNSNISGPGKALADIYKISIYGDIKLIKRHKNWFKGWNQFTIVDLDNDNKNELLCYAKNTTNGQSLGDIYDVSSAGDVRLIKRHTNWFKGWNQIVFDNLGGSTNGELFFYGRGSKYGISQTAKINASGVLSTLKSNRKINPQLRKVISIRTGQRTPSNLLFYSKESASFHNLKAFGYKAKAGWKIASPSSKGELLGTRNAAWILADYPDGPQRLNTNLNSTALNKVVKYFQEVSEGRFKLNNIPIVGPIKIDRSCADFPKPLATTFRNFVIQKANENGLNVKKFDTSPRDGIVTPQELGVTIISNCPAGKFGAAAIARDADVNLNSVRYRGGVASGGANTNLLTMTHELVHFFGDGFDLYPDENNVNRRCNCSGATLMEATITPSFNQPLIHLDPFHRLIFGWLKPRAFDLSKFPPSKVSIGLTRGGRPIKNTKAPFILFNSKKGYKEYFIVEYRSKTSEYDKGVVDDGVAIWHVNGSSARKFKDEDVKLIRNQTTGFWNNNNGAIKLKWANGQYLPVSISVDPSSANAKEVNVRLKPI